MMVYFRQVTAMLDIMKSGISLFVGSVKQSLPVEKVGDTEQTPAYNTLLHRETEPQALCVPLGPDSLKRSRNSDA